MMQCGIDKFEYSDVPTCSIVHPSVDIDEEDPEDCCEMGLTYLKNDKCIFDDFYDPNGHIVLDADGLDNPLENEEEKVFVSRGIDNYSYYKKIQEIYDSGITELEAFWNELSTRLVKEDGWQYLKFEAD